MPKPEGYKIVPTMFLEAEAELKLSIYLYLPINNDIICIRKKGEVLSLSELLNIQKVPFSRIIAPEKELDEAMNEIARLISGSVHPDGDVGLVAHEFAQNELAKMAQIESADSAQTSEATHRALNESSDLVSKVVNRFQELTTKTANADFILSLEQGSSRLDTHNKHVCALSVLILLCLGNCSPNEVTDLAFAALVHDHCLDELPEIFLARHLNGANLSLDAMKGFSGASAATDYKSHIERILKRLSNAGFPVSYSVIKTISQHHENYDGSGLYNIKGPSIFRLAKILRIADDLIALVHSDTEPSSLSEAFKKLQSFVCAGSPQTYDPALMNQLAEKLFS